MPALSGVETGSLDLRKLIAIILNKTHGYYDVQRVRKLTESGTEVLSVGQDLVSPVKHQGDNRTVRELPRVRFR